LIADDDVAGQLAEALASSLDPGFECGIYHPAAPHVTYPGLDGLRACWRDWLAPWASYRTEIEELIDVGERVVVIARDYGRREAGAAEVEQRNAAVWTVRDGRIVRAEFYAGDRTEALAAVGLAEEPHPDRPDAGR
jgi:ketosteroid isomerase-like protein